MMNFKSYPKRTVSLNILLIGQIQCFAGSRSVFENLKLIPVDLVPKLNLLKESEKAVLMEGSDGVISHTLQDRIWEMIWKRWCYYEDFCNSRRDG